MTEFEPWLTFSKRERIGIFTLASLIVAISLAIKLLPEKSKSEVASSLDNYIIQLDSLYIKEDFATRGSRKNTFKPTKKKERYSNVKSSGNATMSFERDSLLILNPNEASISDLIKIGVPQRVAETLDRFRSKGGKFFKANDIMKIYGMSPEIFDQISSQLNVPQQKKRKWKEYPKTEYKTEIPKTILVEVNSADKEQLMAIRGIGPYYAGKIIAYRESLGGYYSLDQLTEIEKLSDSTFLQLKPSFTLNPEINKRNLNSTSLKDLTYHPYISKQQAREILTHRDFNLKLRSWKELQNLLKITPKEVERIQAYFDIQ